MRSRRLLKGRRKDELGAIERKALRKYKTLSSSRYWIHEADVPSYRDLILGEISEIDYKRGYAWLVKL